MDRGERPTQTGLDACPINIPTATPTTILRIAPNVVQFSQRLFVLSCAIAVGQRCASIASRKRSASVRMSLAYAKAARVQ
jgi:hypothetical protein